VCVLTGILTAGSPYSLIIDGDAVGSCRSSDTGKWRASTQSSRRYCLGAASLSFKVIVRSTGRTLFVLLVLIIAGITSAYAVVGIDAVRLRNCCSACNQSSWPDPMGQPRSCQSWYARTEISFSLTVSRSLRPGESFSWFVSLFFGSSFSARLAMIAFLSYTYDIEMPDHKYGCTNFSSFSSGPRMTSAASFRFPSSDRLQLDWHFRHRHCFDQRLRNGLALFVREHRNENALAEAPRKIADRAGIYKWLDWI
jgi:hypothetical protein